MECTVRWMGNDAGMSFVAETDPKVFTRIHFHYRVKGRNLKRDAVARAIELSKDKYCSASIMMAQTAELTYDFEIVEEA